VTALKRTETLTAEDFGRMAPREVRQAMREGRFHLPTTRNVARGHVQCALVVLPQRYAFDFMVFCQRNHRPCPVYEVTDRGSWEPRRVAPGADLRTDLALYHVYRHGKPDAKVEAITDLWRDDLVAFLLGCSLTFEHALMDAGVGVRNVERGTLVPMFVSNLTCRPAGRFHGPMVVTMRPISEAQVQLAGELTARYPHAHGAPLHAGSPQAIGIVDLDRPDYGDPVTIHPGEVPVFWACGVTPQAVALETRPELMITHEPGIMFLTDLPREGDSRL
jgi:uncharacterized protein YcsI (UPF0317 family)